MTDDLNPQGPAQPSLDQAYETKGNAATKEPVEENLAQKHAQDASLSKVTDQRIPPTQSSSTDDVTPSSMARGIHGAPPGEEARGLTQEDVGHHKELDADQLGTFAEDKIANAVKGEGSGTGGREPGLETGLDRKKAEQAPLREQMKEKTQEDFDVGGILGQRGAPANPVDKNNYPNSDRV